VLRVRSRAPGFADGTSLRRRRTDRLPAGHPSDWSAARSPRPRGPIWHASHRGCPRGWRRRCPLRRRPFL